MDNQKSDTKEVVSPLLSEFQKYPLLPAIYDELGVFLERKNDCLLNNSMENKAYLCQAYELLFTSIKHEMHCGRISEGDFLHLKHVLQEESAV